MIASFDPDERVWRVGCPGSAREMPNGTEDRRRNALSETRQSGMRSYPNRRRWCSHRTVERELIVRRALYYCDFPSPTPWRAGRFRC